MSLRIEVSTGSLLKPLSKGVCVECKDRWAASKILEVMEMINWTNVENLDLSIIESFFFSFIIYRNDEICKAPRNKKKCKKIYVYNIHSG